MGLYICYPSTAIHDLTYLLMGTFSYMYNVQRYLLWGFCICYRYTGFIQKIYRRYFLKIHQHIFILYSFSSLGPPPTLFLPFSSRIQYSPPTCCYAYLFAKGFLVIWSSKPSTPPLFSYKSPTPFNPTPSLSSCPSITSTPPLPHLNFNFHHILDIFPSLHTQPSLQSSLGWENCRVWSVLAPGISEVSWVDAGEFST